MAKSKTAEDTIKYLEELEKNTKIITIDLSVPKHRKILNEYIKDHVKNTNQNKPVADLNFNDFLANHEDFKDQCKGKVVVAEITGGKNGAILGYDKNDKYSDHSLHIDGGDFTGCRLHNIELHEMSNISFRDSVLDNVRIMEGNVSDIDFRGSDFHKCEFFSNNAEHQLKNIHLALANPNSVQDKQVFMITNGSMLALELSNINEEIETQKNQAIIEKIKEYTQNKRWVSGYYDLISPVKPDHWGSTLKKEHLSKALQDDITKIENHYKDKQKKREEKAYQRNATRFENPILDPTYTPNQSKERANAIKVPLPVTRQDLVEYQKYIENLHLPVTKQDSEAYEKYKENLQNNENAMSLNYFIAKKYHPFNDFIAQKHSQKLEEIKNTNPEKMVIPVANLSKTDLSAMNLSNLNLSGVNISYAEMQSCILNNTNLSGSCLEGSNVTKASFDGANLTDSNMIGIIAPEARFYNTIMIRTRFNCSDLKESYMENAIGFRAVFTRSNMEKASFLNADMRQSELNKTNLRDVDARYAKMQKTNFSYAIADYANFSYADLSDTIANNFKAEEAIFKETIMDRIKAHHINLRKATITKLSTLGGDFSYADFKEIKDAAGANFTKSILDFVDATGAKLDNMIATEVQAKQMILKHTTLKNLQGKRMDISGAIIDYADFTNSQLEGMVAEEVKGQKAKFKDAILNKVNFNKSIFIGADFGNTQLKDTEALGTTFLAANFQNANVKNMSIDEKTILIDANLRGIVGDEKTVELLRTQQKAQHEYRKQLFGESQYGGCNPQDASDRFKCQRLGAAVLSSALAGGAGTVLAGHLAGVSSAVLAALINDNVLKAAKNQYFDELGYINNSLGDRLAEVGAVAMSMGIGATDRAIDGAVAGLVCSFAGVVQGAVLTTLGIGTALGGLKLVKDGIEQKSRWKKITGMVVSGVGAVASFFGISALGASINTIAYGAAIGGITGGVWAGASAAKRLWEYDNDNPKAGGARPEQIYQENIERAKGIWRKIMPTMKKVMVGLALGIVAAAVTVAAIHALPTIPFIGAAVGAMVMTNAGITAAAAGFFVGYLYDDKIIPIKRVTQPEESKKEKPVQIASHKDSKNKTLNKEKSLEHKKNKAKDHSQEHNQTKNLIKKYKKEHQARKFTKIHKKQKSHAQKVKEQDSNPKERKHKQ